VWVEFLLAVIVEGYREFLEWWQTRSFFRRRGRLLDEEPEATLGAHPPASSIGAEPLAKQVERILDRHGRKHTGIALGVYRQGEELTFARGQARVDRLAPPTAETIFEIGSITKVFWGRCSPTWSKTVSSSSAIQCSAICQMRLRSRSEEDRSRSPISRRRRAGCHGSRQESSGSRCDSARTPMRTSRSQTSSARSSRFG
jgi:Beta-lactamase